jgi:protoporphyrinogen oxidase
MPNTLEYLRFPPLRLADKFRLALTILYASRIKNWRKLEEVTVIEWLRRWSGKRTTEKIWLPLLRAKLGENYKKASAAFIWAIIARMYAARRTGLKKEMFGYLPGGYARILERFAGQLAAEHVQIRLGCGAKKVARVPGGQVGVEFTNGQREVFDRVVLTTAAPIAARLCPDLSPGELQQLNGIEYQGIICASLLLKRGLANYYVTNITDSWVPFTAVIEMSALVDRENLGGNALVYLPKYVTQDDPALSMSDDEIRETFLSALERMYPNFSRQDVLCFRISRVRYVLAVPTLRYSQRLPPVTTSVPGVHILNSAHIINGTLNVNETIRLAEEGAAQFLSRTDASVLAPVNSGGIR